MNLMPQVLDEHISKDPKIKDLQEYAHDNKIKFSNKPDLKYNNNNIEFYHNCVPIIPESRDVYKKNFDVTTTILVNWKKIPLFGYKEGNEETKKKTVTFLYNQLSPENYCFLNTCDKDHTRTKTLNSITINIVYSDKKKLNVVVNFLDKCFYTLEESIKDKELLKKSKIKQIKLLTSNILYQDSKSLI